VCEWVRVRCIETFCSAEGISCAIFCVYKNFHFNATSPKSTRSRDSDFSASRGTTWICIFGWIWICTKEFEFLDLDFGDVSISVESFICTAAHGSILEGFKKSMCISCVRLERDLLMRHRLLIETCMNTKAIHRCVASLLQRRPIILKKRDLYEWVCYCTCEWVIIYLKVQVWKKARKCVCVCVWERKTETYVHAYGVATISRLLKSIGLFCKRALWKRLYSAKETCNCKEPANRSHPIAFQRGGGIR